MDLGRIGNEQLGWGTSRLVLVPNTVRVQEMPIGVCPPGDTGFTISAVQFSQEMLCLL
jgi:hypothetical protein